MKYILIYIIIAVDGLLRVHLFNWLYQIGKTMEETENLANPPNESPFLVYQNNAFNMLDLLVKTFIEVKT